MSRYTVLSNLLGGEMLSSFFESAVYFFMQEIWKKVTIEPFSEYYEVSNLGRVRSIDREVRAYNCKRSYEVKGIMLKQKTNKGGYKCVDVYANGKRKSFRVHRLVALAFVENPNPEEYSIINHKDENKQNNAYTNLEWCTVQYNNTYGSSGIRLKEQCKAFIALDADGMIAYAYSKLDEAVKDGFKPHAIQAALNGRKKRDYKPNTNPEHRYKGLSWWYV